MATFSTSVSAGDDDAVQVGSTVTLTNANNTVDATGELSGMRFLNVTIPPGSTINNAYLTLHLPSTANDSPDVTIRAEANINPSTFTTASNDLSGRTKTSSGVTWTASDIGTGSKNSPDIATLVQDVIDLPSWASGNPMAFYLIGNSSSGAIRHAAFEDTEAAPMITIDYTEPAAGGNAGPLVNRQPLASLVGPSLVG